jgi:hypothetical protein
VDARPLGIVQGEENVVVYFRLSTNGHLSVYRDGATEERHHLIDQMTPQVIEDSGGVTS